MNEVDFSVEFNNEVDEVKESENKYYAQAAGRLKQLAEEHDDILGGVVNLRVPSKGHQTPYIYEVKIVVHMKAEQIVVTENGKQLQSTLGRTLDVVERQVHEHREKQRSY